MNKSKTAWLIFFIDLFLGGYHFGVKLVSKVFIDLCSTGPGQAGSSSLQLSRSTANLKCILRIIALVCQAWLLLFYYIHKRVLANQRSERCFSHVKKKVVRPVSQHNKHKQKHNDQILLSLYFRYT